jgi:hypothetical protein
MRFNFQTDRMIPSAMALWDVVGPYASGPRIVPTADSISGPGGSGET